jgi:predicted nucleic acid-binding protein
MKEVVILDTGPLVAWFCETDSWHQWAAEQFGLLEPPLVTCEPVLTEACFLYARQGGQSVKIVNKVQAGALNIGLEICNEAASLETLMKRYADAPMALADACVVRLAEIHKDCRVFTVDRHFKRYRRYGRSMIPLLSPW